MDSFQLSECETVNIHTADDWLFDKVKVLPNYTASILH